MPNLGKSLQKIGNKHKSYQIAKHKGNGKYVKQRDRTRNNKIKHITEAISHSIGDQLAFLEARLEYWKRV
jgi:hypothetical protein